MYSSWTALESLPCLWIRLTSLLLLGSRMILAVGETAASVNNIAIPDDTSSTDNGGDQIPPITPLDNENNQWYWLEVKAIIGGVLGFWGGVGGLGTLFLVVVLSQRYCCKKNDDKDDSNG